MSNEKLDILIEGVNELRLVVHALMDRQDELDAKMDALTMEVHQLKADVAELKQDVAVLKQDVAELKQDVAVLKQDVAVLKQDVAMLKQDVAELKEGQDRHERILETLALRALEWNNFRLDFIRKSS
ncbi:hypothetical protein [Brevibacillus brevis]|uniref:hypothetical protein n=1 Tax=Brevibacillus brevis TaxID=1393 RepID=UPI000D0E7560|nr:hypothetical protein [Brevibacillus brevis]PSJ69250.1 hypothetical protein C7J99_11150 [Brevibacillus brevis]RED27456.1 hypothetical protein DES34_110148 [Brevibacillus brevis]GEC90806.1 hypothetical protein BBR01nite_31370 [Brevibacillus brevis]VEF91309.1 chromosome segregation protein SMC [Brevibacillus brevis]